MTIDTFDLRGRAGRDGRRGPPPSFVAGRMTGVTGPSLWLRRVRPNRTTLFRKFAGVLGTLVVTALLINAGVGTWLFYEEHRASLVARQEEQARMAAESLGQFLRNLEGDIGWLVQLPWAGTGRTSAARRAPAPRPLARGHRSRLLRSERQRVGKDLRSPSMSSRRPGPVVGPPLHPEPRARALLRSRLLPPGIRAVSSVWRWPGDGRIRGWRSRRSTSIRSGISRRASRTAARGTAYLVDGTGRLIAHPDISLVLRRSDLSGLAQVQAALGQGTLATGQTFSGLGGKRVVAAAASVPRTDWKILVEVPVAEAFAPVNRSLVLSALLLLATLAVSAIVGLALARRMVVPVRMLEAGAARIASGDLSHRIAVHTGDEIEDLAAGFNAMAQRLETLVQRPRSEGAGADSRTGSQDPGAPEAKTRELEIASDHKSASWRS